MNPEPRWEPQRPEQAEAAFCGACGQVLATADHAGCARLLTLDPARFCGVCGFRLDVQVFPDGVRSSCRECRRRARRDAKGG